MTEIPIGLVSICIPAVFGLFKHVSKFGSSALFVSYATSERRLQQNMMRGASRANSTVSVPHTNLEMLTINSKSSPIHAFGHTPISKSSHGSVGLDMREESLQRRHDSSESRESVEEIETAERELRRPGERV